MEIEVLFREFKCIREAKYDGRPWGGDEPYFIFTSDDGYDLRRKTIGPIKKIKTGSTYTHTNDVYPVIYRSPSDGLKDENVMIVMNALEADDESAEAGNKAVGKVLEKVGDIALKVAVDTIGVTSKVATGGLSLIASEVTKLVAKEAYNEDDTIGISGALLRQKDLEFLAQTEGAFTRKDTPFDLEFHVNGGSIEGEYKVHLEVRANNVTKKNCYVHRLNANAQADDKWSLGKTKNLEGYYNFLSFGSKVVANTLLNNRISILQFNGFDYEIVEEIPDIGNLYRPVILGPVIRGQRGREHIIAYSELEGICRLLYDGTVANTGTQKSKRYGEWLRYGIGPGHRIVCPGVFSKKSAQDRTIDALFYRPQDGSAKFVTHNIDSVSITKTKWGRDWDLIVPLDLGKDLNALLFYRKGDLTAPQGTDRREGYIKIWTLKPDCKLDKCIYNRKAYHSWTFIAQNRTTAGATGFEASAPMSAEIIFHSSANGLTEWFDFPSRTRKRRLEDKPKFFNVFPDYGLRFPSIDQAIAISLS